MKIHEYGLNFCGIDPEGSAVEEAMARWLDDAEHRVVSKVSEAERFSSCDWRKIESMKNATAAAARCVGCRDTIKMLEQLVQGSLDAGGVGRGGRLAEGGRSSFGRVRGF